MELTVAELAERIGAELVGDGCGQVSSVGPIEAAGGDEVTFVSNTRHLPKLEGSCAGAVILSECIEGLDRPQLVVRNVDAALIEVLSIFAPEHREVAAGIDPTARLADDAKIAEGVSVGPYVIIETGVEIGEKTVISSGCRIGENSRLGKNCRLDSNVVVYHNCRIGNSCVIQANTTIGSTGFGYSFIDGVHRLIPHNGGVVIEDFVEVGANCCIDRAKFGNTIIGAGTKMDNLVQIGHNVVIGRCCLITALVGIGGSCKLGDGVVLGGQAGVAHGVEIGDGVMVGGQAGVIKDVEAGRKLWGTPAIDGIEELRLINLTRRLPKLAERLKKLIARIERLEAAEDDKE